MKTGTVKVNFDGRGQHPNGLYPRNINPFTGVQYDITVTFDKNNVYRIISYEAYNAMGLIGSEHNGIAILDENKKQVLTDLIMQAGSGWGGVSNKVFAEMDRLSRLTLDEFKEFVNTNDRTRYTI